MAAQRSAIELVDAGIQALAHNDVAELDRLTEAAAQVRSPEFAQEQSGMRLRMRTFDHLLVLTRRNLRLLRGTGSMAYGPSGEPQRPIRD